MCVHECEHVRACVRARVNSCNVVRICARICQLYFVCVRLFERKFAKYSQNETRSLGCLAFEFNLTGSTRPIVWFFKVWLDAFDTISV